MAGETEERDDIGADLRAALAGTLGVQEAPETPPELQPEGDGTAAPANETAVQTADRKRDEAGRFAKGQRETLTAKPKVDAAPATASRPGEQPAKPALAPEIDKAGKHLERIPPPAAWNGAGKVEWDRMPRAVREQLSADYAKIDTERAEIAPLRELIDQNRALLVNEAGSVVEGHRQLMAFARMSVDNPAQLIQTIARAKGVDLVALAGGQQRQAAPNQQQPTNDIDALVARKVEQRLQPVMAHLEQTSQQQTQATVREVEAFAADPAYPFFNDVAQDVIRRLKSGEIPDGPPIQRLKQAYDASTWSNPTIRPHLMAAQGEEEAKRKAAEVERARKAQRGLITGAPAQGASSRPLGDPNASIRDTLVAGLNEQLGRV